MENRRARSAEITEHICEECPSCRGGSHNTVDHYALGKLRQKIGVALGLDHYTTQQLDLSSLIKRHREAGSPALAQ